jgi:hypothetical protein
MITVRQRRLPGMNELAAYFRAKARLPDEELARLTLAARAADSRWDDMAAACGISTCKDLAGVVYRITGETGAELLFSATHEAVRQLAGSEHRYPPLTWACAGCGQQVTDRAPAGRPVHVQHGHGPGCARLARDQAAEDERRRAQVPDLILDSEPAAGPVQPTGCASGSPTTARGAAGTGTSTTIWPLSLATGPQRSAMTATVTA